MVATKVVTMAVAGAVAGVMTAAAGVMTVVAGAAMADGGSSYNDSCGAPALTLYMYIILLQHQQCPLLLPHSPAPPINFIYLFT